MKKITPYLVILFISLNAALAGDIQNKTYTPLIFKNIKIPEAPPVAAVMVAYLDIVNNNKLKQTIIKIDSPQFKRVEIHNMSMKNGMMNMQPVKKLSIRAKETISLKPGGLHIMLIKPDMPLKRGDDVELIFRLMSGEVATINTKVRYID